MSETKNQHIERYLDYFCNLPSGSKVGPGFSVLINGKWGSGKTWAIQKYQEKRGSKKQKFLYISLYGLNSAADIDNEILRLLHPILSSKEMQFAGKLIQSATRLAINVDINSDNKNDTTVDFKPPKIDLPGSLKKLRKSILIFDDLERANIEVTKLLAYINNFVEHQGLRVILIANEEKIKDRDKYRFIKEKMIGQTLSVLPDLNAAMHHFCEPMKDEIVKNFLLEKFGLVSEIYSLGKYENLRSLRKIILDFERIYELLEQDMKSNPELLTIVDPKNWTGS